MAPSAILPTAAPAHYAVPRAAPLPRRAASSSQKSKHLLWTLTPSPAAHSLIDATTLLTDSDLAPPEPCLPEEGAKPKRRRACKNCSCGLAEEEEAAAASLPTPPSERTETGSGSDAATAKQSERARLLQLAAEIERGELRTACGKCSMGDAFRCPSCPYVGMPAFTPGHKVEIDFGDL